MFASYPLDKVLSSDYPVCYSASHDKGNDMPRKRLRVHKTRLLRLFGTQRAIAETLRISVQAVQQWTYVPENRMDELRERRPELFEKEGKK